MSFVLSVVLLVVVTFIQLHFFVLLVNFYVISLFACSNIVFL